MTLRRGRELTESRARFASEFRHQVFGQHPELISMVPEFYRLRRESSIDAHQAAYVASKGCYHCALRLVSLTH